MLVEPLAGPDAPNSPQTRGSQLAYAYTPDIKAALALTGLVVAAALVAATAAGRAPVPISGASATQQRVIRTVLAQLRSPRITAVTFRTTPDSAYRGGQEMDVSGVDKTIRTTWVLNLFVAAYLRESLLTGTEEPKLIVLNGESDIPVHAPRRPGEKVSPASRASATVIAAYVSSLKAAASVARARVVGLEVLRPGPIGVALRLRVSDPARFLKNRINRFLAAFDKQPAGILARYVGIQGPNRARIFELGVFPTSRWLYVDPSLLGCNLFGISMPGMTKIPPCPAQ